MVSGFLSVGNCLLVTNALAGESGNILMTLGGIPRGGLQSNTSLNAIA